jgi:hypothetical protein
MFRHKDPTLTRFGDRRRMRLAVQLNRHERFEPFMLYRRLETGPVGACFRCSANRWRRVRHRERSRKRTRRIRGDERKQRILTEMNMEVVRTTNPDLVV